MTHSNVQLLVLYYSRHGTTRLLANQIARGIESVTGCEAVLRTVAELEPNSHSNHAQDATASLSDLKQCDGLALGSPVWFGNMSAAMKHFWDQTSPLWVSGDLIDKPACVFTSASTPHGGQESTIQSMTLPLFHHGMLVMGLPYSEPNLHTSIEGCSPYGVSTIDTPQLAAGVAQLAFSQGKRLAQMAKKIKFASV